MDARNRVFLSSENSKHSSNKGALQNKSVEGCNICKRDDDHAKLLLCEMCNDEYHIYCLDPPLKAVPDGDFFCDKCLPRHSTYIQDGLEDMVAALPPMFTSRFGEIVWAWGGGSYGFWPACVYDPRLAVGGPRKLALKNLGKKHLVYFFECHEAPFSVLVDSKIQGWEDGLLEEYDLGKVAKAAGKARSLAFEQALQAALMENDKPIEYRLDWNHGGESNFDHVRKAALSAREQRTSNNRVGLEMKSGALNEGIFTPPLITHTENSSKKSDTKASDVGNHSVEGCNICKRDDDHAKLLLCEMCNDEYHIYCLDPPLKAVPDGDFFCDKCLPRHSTYIQDGLEDMVAALPPMFTSRFGEIVWAWGGGSYGFWPACVYDPRLAVGGPRKLALKNLGKKHLVYFFECHEAPFSVLVDSKIQGWEDGLLEEYDLGKVAKAAGKARSLAFEQALQAALMENDKPIEYRLDWNHGGESNFDHVRKAALSARELRTSNNGGGLVGKRASVTAIDSDRKPPKKRDKTPL